MAEVKVRTNNKPRDVLRWCDLTEKERKEFDWIESSSVLTTDDVEFFRYKGWTYCLSDFERIAALSPFPGRWDGYHGDSYFSGVLVRYANDCEQVICGTYTC